MNLIVHIGTPKTGTTTIQEVLFRNKDALQSKGFHFLQCAGPKNNRALPAYCVNDEKDDNFFIRRRIVSVEEKSRFRGEFRAKLSEELSSLGADIHTVIMSSEQFSERLTSGREIRRFYDLVSPFFSSVRILCWLREQCEMASSYYSTALRSGDTHRFEDYIEECRPDSTPYNYYKMLNRWSAVFGAGSVSVRVFSRNAFVDEDFVYDFLASVSPDLINVIDKNVVLQNASMSAFGQRLVLSLNRLWPKYTDGEHKTLSENAPLRRRLVRKIEVLFPGRGFTPSASEYQRIYDSFYKSNKALNNKYLGKSGALFDFRPPSQRRVFSALVGFSWAGLLMFSRFYVRAHSSLSSGIFNYCKFAVFHCFGVPRH